MTTPARLVTADPRFAEGVALFNSGRYFDAHEVWESLWRDCTTPDRRFVHALIHAAVALYQWGRGNRTGARLQFDRGRAKASEYAPDHLGLDSAGLWQAIAAVLDAPPGSRLESDITPTLRSHDKDRR